MRVQLRCQHATPFQRVGFLAKDLGSIIRSSNLHLNLILCSAKEAYQILTSTGRAGPLSKKIMVECHQKAPWPALLLRRGSSTLLSSASLVPRQTLLSIADVQLGSWQTNWPTNGEILSRTGVSNLCPTLSRLWDNFRQAYYRAWPGMPGTGSERKALTEVNEPSVHARAVHDRLESWTHWLWW